MVLQDPFLHGLQQVKNGVAIRMGQPKAQDVGRDGSRVGRCQPWNHPSGEEQSQLS